MLHHDKKKDRKLQLKAMTHGAHARKHNDDFITQNPPEV